MEESMITAYRQLLTHVCADNRRLSVVVGLLEIESNSRKRYSSSDTKAIANVHKALKARQIGMAVNMLKLKTNRAISDKLLNYIAAAYDCSPPESEEEGYTPDSAHINDENAAGFLAYFILKQDEAGCAALMERIITEKKEPIEQKSASSLALNNEENEKNDKKLKRENAKLTKKIALLEQQNTALSADLDQQLYAAVVAREEAERLAVEKTKAIEELKEKLATLTALLETAKKTATQQSIENEKQQGQIKTLEERLLQQTKQQAPKKEIYFIGDQRGLPQDGEYQFILGSRDEREDWTQILNSGMHIWIVLLEASFALKRKAKKFNGEQGIRLFESKKELIQFVQTGEQHGF